MNPNGGLLRALPELSSPARQELEQNLLCLLRQQSVSPELAVHHARNQLPKIVPLVSPSPGVAARISPATGRQLEQLHHQAATGVRQLQQGLRPPAAAASQPASPACPTPRPASKPSWLRSRWLWFFLFGVVLPTAWIGAALWARHSAQVFLRQATKRLVPMRADAATQQQAVRQLESRLSTLQEQAQANLTTQRDKLVSEVAELRDAVSRGETNSGLPSTSSLPSGWPAAFAVPTQARDPFGNPVVTRQGRRTDPASGWPLEIGHRASGLTLVLIPAGQFQMGSLADEAGRDDDEGPVHSVRFNQPFYLSKYEVTQEQWRQVMGGNPSRFTGGSRRPVENVSWHDAQRFVGKLNESLAEGPGPRFGLPSEAQWEYACRAGSTGRYGFGDDAAQLGEYAWFNKNSGDATHPVGRKKPNEWGLYDMHGNVWEWCEDVWHGGYRGAPTDGQAWTEGGEQSRRVLRGGSWYDLAGYARAAGRDWYHPGYRSDHDGVRVGLGVGARTP